MRLEGLGVLKNPMASSGIESSAFNLAAKCLNQFQWPHRELNPRPFISQQSTSTNSNGLIRNSIPGLLSRSRVPQSIPVASSGIESPAFYLTAKYLNQFQWPNWELNPRPFISQHSASTNYTAAWSNAYSIAQIYSSLKSFLNAVLLETVLAHIDLRISGK
jgi:hypothetical protein